MDGISTHPNSRDFNSTVEQLMDILSGLKLVFPASISMTLKGLKDEAAAKRQ
ncbi:hypothetical protein QM327_16380 [Pantoea dispersa]|uniref:hypothetical protein n=1 Tax=Pantoea dispersa TaxID=59814 RepID=UPI00241ED915|nr:hypothetical protein [Pantoea dispersa]MDI9768131.1 hypothetical protein [Pantoea dispersa]